MPATFPAIFADRLRAEGVTLNPEYDLFYGRRRVKSETELAGMRRAQRAAEGGDGRGARSAAARLAERPKWEWHEHCRSTASR